ncbi:class I SAM-dependent methyltransferase [Actinocrinis sp.]|uniref:class I SAM-dependent methyltransferase n=1 Tax=Actinocrinis sp. TaxID=1920516 RepID=UPI002D1A65E5|nr:class I SAM-dependent methyltransferase [Actinocrinis sp.]HXR70370.1 class I SAM-dependent methyltransferase [Actinocrinis sp.]
MSIRSRIFAATYDRMMAKGEKQGLRELRQRLIAQADGRVIEIGGGTGHNLAHYPAEVTALTVTEPEPPMVRRLQRHAAERAPLATVLRAPAEDLPFEDDSFDTAVSTLVLCGVDDQQRALRELIRVLRPGGRLLFLEHVRSDDVRLARRQNRVNWLNQFMVGCDCNRPTLESIREAGFVPDQIEHGEFPAAPSFVRPLIIGSATAPKRVDTDTAGRSAGTINLPGPNALST